MVDVHVEGDQVQRSRIVPTVHDKLGSGVGTVHVFASELRLGAALSTYRILSQRRVREDGDRGAFQTLLHALVQLAVFEVFILAVDPLHSIFQV